MTQSEKAKSWRLKHSLSVSELGALTGYSIEAIYAFERGATPARTWTRPPSAGKRARKSAAPQPIQDWVWLRYKNTCAGVERKLRTGKEWDWSA